MDNDTCEREENASVESSILEQEARTVVTPRRYTREQLDTLIVWLAAEYSTPLINKWMEERGWRVMNRSTLSRYRKRYRDLITALRAERHERAMKSGLALKEERIARLASHADKLEEIKYEYDKAEKLSNAKEWRETLADIAAELGDRKTQVEQSGSMELVVRYVNDWRSPDGN